MASGIIAKYRFYGVQELPPKPGAPSVDTITAEDLHVSNVGNSEAFLKILANDLDEFGIMQSNTRNRLKKVFEYQSWDEGKVLKPGKRLEAAGLKISMKKGRHGGRYSSMDLIIENTTKHFLAYRIMGQPNRAKAVCGKKEPLAHNAMVIRPRQKIRRVECVYKSGWQLNLESVETLKVPELSAVYISQLPPLSAGVEPRIAQDHFHTHKKMCGGELLKQTTPHLRAKRTTWRDVIDYFGRHNCFHYEFVENYKAFEKYGQYELPVVGS